MQHVIVLGECVMVKKSETEDLNSSGSSLSLYKDIGITLIIRYMMIMSFVIMKRDHLTDATM